MEQRHSIIVGAGIAGMSCALKLQEAGYPYTLISDTIGGRICYRPEHHMNFGAVFYMKGYTHARELLTPAKAVLPSLFDLECHAELGRGYGVLSGRVIGAAPELLSFLRYLKCTFGTHYARFKVACETHEMSEALAHDPYMQELFDTSATDFIAQHHFEKAANAVVSQFVHACTGSSIGALNALDYLNCAMGLVDTAMRFTFDAEAMRDQLDRKPGSVVDQRVAGVERAEAGWRVRTEAGAAYEASKLVLATPADVTQRLLEPIIGPYEIRQASTLHAYKVSGAIKQDYAGHRLHLFDERIPLINISARDDGAYEVFTCEPLDMGIFFDDYEVLWRKDWGHALFTTPSIVLDQDLGDGLYRAGDHNALGLEPAAISGIFVANRIIEQA